MTTIHNTNDAGNGDSSSNNDLVVDVNASVVVNRNKPEQDENDDDDIEESSVHHETYHAPTDNCVLCGVGSYNGKGIQHHSGNIYFREVIVRKRLSEYVASPTAQQRNAIILDAIEDVHNIGGLFLSSTTTTTTTKTARTTLDRLGSGEGGSDHNVIVWKKVELEETMVRTRRMFTDLMRKAKFGTGSRDFLLTEELTDHDVMIDVTAAASVTASTSTSTDARSSGYTKKNINGGGSMFRTKGGRTSFWDGIMQRHMKEFMKVYKCHETCRDIAHMVVTEVHELDPPGRFLLSCHPSQLVWRVLTVEEAVDKILDTFYHLKRIQKIHTPLNFLREKRCKRKQKNNHRVSKGKEAPNDLVSLIVSPASLRVEVEPAQSLITPVDSPITSSGSSCSASSDEGNNSDDGRRQRRRKVLCLGMSYPDVKEILRDSGVTDPEATIITLQKSTNNFVTKIMGKKNRNQSRASQSTSSPSSTTRSVLGMLPAWNLAAQCVDRKHLTAMDGRDLARIMSTESVCHVDVYTVSQGKGAVYRSDRHLHANFNMSRQLIQGIQECWSWQEQKQQPPLSKDDDEEHTNETQGTIVFDEIVLDYFWIPPFWTAKHWNTSFFQKTLVDIVKNGHLKITNKFRGKIYLPFCLHCFKEIMKHRNDLLKYFDISFLRKHQMAEISLWRGTQAIDEGVCQQLFGKKRDQEEEYCTFDKRRIMEGMEDPVITRENLVDLACSIDDFADIRFIVLQALPPGQENSKKKRKVIGMHEKISDVKNGLLQQVAQAKKPAAKEVQKPGRKRKASPVVVGTTLPHDHEDDDGDEGKEGWNGTMHFTQPTDTTPGRKRKFENTSQPVPKEDNMWEDEESENDLDNSEVIPSEVGRKASAIGHEEAVEPPDGENPRPFQFLFDDAPSVCESYSQKMSFDSSSSFSSISDSLSASTCSLSPSTADECDDCDEEEEVSSVSILESHDLSRPAGYRFHLNASQPRLQYVENDSSKKRNASSVTCTSPCYSEKHESARFRNDVYSHSDSCPIPVTTMKPKKGLVPETPMRHSQRLETTSNIKFMICEVERRIKSTFPGPYFETELVSGGTNDILFLPRNRTRPFWVLDKVEKTKSRHRLRLQTESVEAEAIAWNQFQPIAATCKKMKQSAASDIDTSLAHYVSSGKRKVSKTKVQASIRTQIHEIVEACNSCNISFEEIMDIVKGNMQSRIKNATCAYDRAHKTAMRQCLPDVPQVTKEKICQEFDIPICDFENALSSRETK